MCKVSTPRAKITMIINYALELLFVVSCYFSYSMYLINRQHEQSEGTSAQPEEGESSRAVSDEGNDMFWGLDDIPGSHSCLIHYGGIFASYHSLKSFCLAVEAKNCLDSPVGRDASLNPFVKPPANLVVLEGDCLDTTGDFGELESYLVPWFLSLINCFFWVNF